MANPRKEYSRQYYLKNKERYAERQREWRARHPEKALAGQYNWNKRNPEKVRTIDRRWKQKHPELLAKHVRRSALRTKYGLTEESYEALLQAQNSVCAVCLRPERRTLRGKPWALSVDHDHTTGEVRGLLCASCNSALGLLEDNPLTISALLAYIQKYKG